MKKEQKTVGKLRFLVPLAVTVLIMCAVSVLLLLGLTAVVFHMELDMKAIQIGIMAIYVLSGLCGGILIGKWKKEKKFLWGILAGISYFLVLLALSFAHSTGTMMDVVHLMTVLILCLVSSMIGGMLS